MVLSCTELKDGAPVSRKLGEDERVLVHRALQTQLRALLGPGPHPAEEMLPDYILTMVDNRRSRDFVAQELNSLLAEERSNLGDEIARWVWAQLERLREQEHGARDQPQASTIHGPIQKGRESSVQRGGLVGPEAAGLGDKQVSLGSSRARGEAPAETLSPPLATSKTSSDSRPAHPTETRFPSPVETEPECEEEQAKIREKPTSRQGGRQSPRMATTTNNSDSTLKRRRAATGKVDEGPESKTIRRDIAQEQVTATSNPASTEETTSAGETDRAHEAAAPNSSTELPPKCQFWPNCRHGSSCKFYHPTELCRFFPHCRAGDRCRYIHPVGRAGAPAGMALMRTMMGLPTQHGIPIPCKYGYACERRRKDRSCPYIHPLVACRYGKECRKKALGTCVFSHAPLCRHGWSCARPGCSFAHPVQESEISPEDNAHPLTPTGEPVASPTSDNDMDAEQTPMAVSES
jgi:hypothetical protein